jgi:5-oxoprolinase (ATP-hydrolysing)
MPTCSSEDSPLNSKLRWIHWTGLTPSFPKCFGPNENEALDPSATAAAFKALAKQIRQESNSTLSLDDIVSRHGRFD